MKRSFTSNSKRSGGPPWGLVVAVGLLLLLEGTLRAFNPLGVLPSPEDREPSYRAVVPELRAFGAPDVAIVGSSRARRAVASPLLRTILRRKGTDVRIGNFALIGAQSEEVELVLRRLLEVDSPPKLLVWPISPRELEGRQRRPVSMVAYLWRPADWWLARKELGTKADQYLPQAIRNEVARHSWIMRYRFALRDLVENPPRRGIAPMLADIMAPSLRELTTMRGGLDPKVEGRGKFHSFDVKRERVERYVGGSYREPEWPKNYQAEHLEQAVQAVTKANVRLVLVELPLHPLLEEVMPPGTSAKFRKHMQGVAKRHHVRFLSLADLGRPFELQDFREQSHVNYQGAEKFTRAIAPFVLKELRGHGKRR